MTPTTRAFLVHRTAERTETDAMAHSTPVDRAAPISQTLLWSVLLVGALAAGYVLFADGVKHTAKWWNEPEYSHSYIVLACSTWIIWQRRHAILAERRIGSWIGVGLVMLGILVSFSGTAAFMQRLPYVGLLVTLAGLGVAGLGNKGMQRLWLPLFLLLFTLQIPGTLYVFVSLEFQLISSQLGAKLLELIGIPVFLNGNVIDLGVMQMQVAEACSGLRYLFPLAAFAFICAWLYKAPWWAKGVVLLATVPITIATNSFRIAMTGILLDQGSLALAEGFMHLFEGWVVFLLALLLLFTLMWGLARLRDRRTGPFDIFDFDRIEAHSSRATNPPTTAIGRPLIAAVGLLIGAAIVQMPLLDRDQYTPPRPGLTTFPMSFGNWIGVPQPIDPQIIRSLGADDYLLTDFSRPGSNGSVNLWIAYYATQVDNAAIHSPKDCLPAGGWEFSSIDAVEAPVGAQADESFKINRALISNESSRMVMYYWLDMRGRKITNEFYLKFINLYDSVLERRSDGALIRFVTPINPEETVAEADARVIDLLRRIYPKLDPHVGA